ncbi:MAG: photosystem II stability/assembly factor-like uncharacterized protein [Planctomycetota bacterium]|jgi:photosystem II stability/assembly factor-like uncharacterized protein
MRALPIVRLRPVATLALGLLLPFLATNAVAQKKEKPRLKPAQGSLPLDWASSLKWRSIGPANMGGRVTDVAAHPTDTSTYWIGTAGAGVLKTSNNGVQYQHQFTSEGSSSIGAIGVAPSNPDVVYVGTGESNPRNSVSWGDGVYKSVDGGDTWKHIGLDESFQIGAIVVHPEDENTVYVAALGRLWGPSDQRGLYKSTNGGDDWERILFVDDMTGAGDVTLHPTNPDVIIAATYERQRDMYDSNDPAKKWGAGSGLWRSTDGGASFERLQAGDGPGTGLPDAKLGRIGINWAASEENTVFAIVETEHITQERADSAFFGITTADAGLGVLITEVTEDSPAAEAGLLKDDVLLRMGERTIVDGDDFTEQLRFSARGQVVSIEVIRAGEPVTVDMTLAAPPEPEEDQVQTDELGYPRAGPFSIGLGGQRANQQDLQGPEGNNFGGVYRSDDGGSTWARINSLNPRPMYYSQIRVDPSDVNKIFVLGTRLYRSFDAGVSFEADGHDGRVHVDHHALWIDPKDGRHMILGNDGGIYVTWDTMENWDHHNHVAMGQFYNVGTDYTRDYMVYGGLQDNGSWGGPNRTSNGGATNGDWFNVGGGDGFVTLVDKNDPELIYSESQNGGMGRRHLGTGERGFMRPRAPKDETYRWNWNTPFILSAHNPKIHYSAGSHVFRSLDRGNAQRAISPKLSHTERGSATSLAESPSDEQRLYVGMDDGSLWTTGDGGVTWVDLWTLNGAEEVAPVEVELEAADIAASDETPKAQEVAISFDDPITGHWDAKAEGAGIEGDDQGKFTLELVLGKEGKISGSLDSQVGAGELREGRYDDSTGKLSFAFVGQDTRLDFTGNLNEDDKGVSHIDGEIVGAGGAFRFDFSARRTPSDGPQETVLAALSEVSEVSDASEAPESDETEAAPEDKEPAKHIKDTIDQLMPGRRYVSQLVASRHKRDRVYATFDGHRSDDGAPYVFVSEDAGQTWTDLRGNLPDHAGSVRALAEDSKNKQVLFLGAEFGCYLSIDMGQSWTRINGDQLPTVPVHDFSLQEAADELVVGTHGRSIWVLELGPIRELTEEVTDADAHLFSPSPAVQWRSEPSPGSTGSRAFQAENPTNGAVIYYSLDKKAREVSLTIENADGTVMRTLDASGEKGLHRVVWDLRASRPTSTSSSSSGRRRFRGGRRATPGTYRVVLEVHGERYTQDVEVRIDPGHPDPIWITNEEAAEELEALLNEGDE